MNLSNYEQNKLVDGLIRGGALNSGGTVNSTAVVTGVWAASTAYTVGQVVVPGSGFTAGGGKFLKCTTAGTSGTTSTLAVPNPGSTLVDGTVTWTAVSGIPSELNLYVALFVINKGLRASSTAYSVGDCVSLTATGGAGGDSRQHLYRCTTAGTTNASQPTTYQGVPGEAITDGTVIFTEMSPVIQTGSGFPSGFTEVSGAGYARVNLAASLTNWSGTQAAASTTTSTGTNGTTSNNGVITYGSPTAAWATGLAAIGAYIVYDQLTGGNPLFFAPLTVPKTVNNGDAAPSFAAAALSLQIDN
jgi:hypothetical protein